MLYSVLLLFLFSSSFVMYKLEMLDKNAPDRSRRYTSLYVSYNLRILIIILLLLLLILLYCNCNAKHSCSCFVVAAVSVCLFICLFILYSLQLRPHAAHYT